MVDRCVVSQSKPIAANGIMLFLGYVLVMPYQYMVFLRVFLRIPIVLLSNPLQIVEGFWCGIHGNRIHVIRNDPICFIEYDLFYLHNGRITDGIWNYICQWRQSSSHDWPWWAVFGENIFS